VPASPSDLPRLRQLHGWLTLESWAGVAGLAGFWLPAAPLAAALGLVAVAFTPLLVHALWHLGRVGWLAAFAVLVGGTMLGMVALGGAGVGLGGALVLLAFYSYTWVLRVAVAEWVREAEEAALWTREKARWAAEAEEVALSA
jgi:hypothetical protein